MLRGAVRKQKVVRKTVYIDDANDGGCCTQIELMGAAGTLNMLGHVIG